MITSAITQPRDLNSHNGYDSDNHVAILQSDAMCCDRARTQLKGGIEVGRESVCEKQRMSEPGREHMKKED